MLQIKMCIIIFLIPLSSARDALQYFIEHRKVLNCSFTMLTNINSSDKIWIEYEYIFINNNDNNSKEFYSNIEQTINVGVYENLNMPFDCKFATKNDKVEGYSIEIMKLLMPNLHFKINYTILKIDTSSEENITNILNKKNIDLLLCHPEINDNSKLRLQQLHPTLKSRYVLVYKPNRLHFTKDIFILTFAGTLWLCFLVLLIILAICLHISTKYYSILYNYDTWNLVDITLWANAAACQQGLSHTPSGFSSCVIFFLGYLTSYLLYTGFAAGITSLLLQEDTNNDVTINDLKWMNVHIASVTNISFLKYTYSFVNNSVHIGRISDFFEYIDQDNTVGIAPKIFVDQYIADNYQVTEQFVTVVIANAHYIRSFAVLKNKTYKKILNNQLLKIQETGLLKNALYRSLLPSPVRVITSNYSSAGIQHVGSAIFILLVGSLSSTVFLMMELLIALYRNKCNTHHSEL